MGIDLRPKYFLPPNDGVELRAFTHGLMPKTVPAMMQHFVDDWRERGVDAWNEVPNHWLPDSDETLGWWHLPEYLGDRFIAPLLGAPEGTCIMQPNVHWSANCLFSDVERFRGKRVVVTDDAFPSVLQPAKRWAELGGFEIVTVPLDADGFVNRAAVLNAVDAPTAAVVLSHVGFTTGERLPDSFLGEVARRARSGGALLVVDGYHAVGTMPIEVQDIGIDVYVGGLLKEASGSSGNAFVYVRDGLEVRPHLTGWFGHEEPFVFSADPATAFEPRRRFLGGTTAVASLYHAVEGARILLDAGLENVHFDSLEKTQYCVDRAREVGIMLRSPIDDERRSALVILDIAQADQLSSLLKNRDIYTDSRLGRYLRLAPFVWNTSDEIDRAFDAIRNGFRELDNGGGVDSGGMPVVP